MRNRDESGCWSLIRGYWKESSLTGLAIVKYAKVALRPLETVENLLKLKILSFFNSYQLRKWFRLRRIFEKWNA